MWTFTQNGGTCKAQLINSTGATLTIQRRASEADEVIFALSNPAWQLEVGSTRMLRVRHHFPAFRDSSGRIEPASYIDDPLFEAEVVRVGNNVAIAFARSKQTFDTYLSGSEIGGRIAIYFGDTALTDWVRLSGLVTTSLNRCSNPFR
ncbi:hypothetical protein [Sphingomonas sp.]|uniref:hypothetical protein n=1 Tax=Sphingomonas sp. TaxID=28214 RepID=UPI0035C84DC2